MTAELGGSDFADALHSRGPDGFELEPLYCEERFATADDPAGLPGVAPFTRGTDLPGAAMPGEARRWLIAQEYAAASTADVNDRILADLQRGANLIWLKLAANQAGSTQWQRPEDVETTLSGVEVGFIEVVLDAGRHSQSAAQLFHQWATARGAHTPELTGCLGCDPLAEYALTGNSQSLDAAPDRVRGEMAWARQHLPAMRALLVSTTPYHDAGASVVQELAFALASATEYLRWASASGAGVEQSADQIFFSYSIGRDFFQEVAKLRAARWLWSKVLKASDGLAAAGRQRIHIRTSDVEVTRVDPWSNLLRGTVQTFAAAIAGADAITAGCFDRLDGPSGDASSRMSVTGQHVLAEEAHLAKVIDPAGGSWFLEHTTDQLARRAWQLFRDIEAAGGMASCLRSGTVEQWLQPVRQARQREVATRRQGIIGVSRFANLTEQRPQHSAKPGVPAESASEPALGAFRAAEAFERLRLASDARAAESVRPRVFQVLMGAPRNYRPRASFAADFLAAGGIECQQDGDFVDTDAALEAFAGSGCRAAVVCADDDTLAESLPVLAAGLKQQGAVAVWVAAPPVIEGVDRDVADPVDAFVHQGCDALAALTDLLRRLEVLP